MAKLCSSCHYIGKGNFSKFYNDWFFGRASSGMVLILVGLFYAFFRWKGEPFNPITFSMSMLVVFFGIFCIIQHYRGGSYCPQCNHTPMLKLDDPESIELIKQHDLKVNKKPPQDSSKQSN